MISCNTGGEKRLNQERDTEENFRANPAILPIEIPKPIEIPQTFSVESTSFRKRAALDALRCRSVAIINRPAPKWPKSPGFAMLVVP